MTYEILRRFADSWPSRSWQDVTVILAVSGGPDSVALARLVSQQQPTGPGRRIVAHFNHGWRAGAADREEVFVRDLASDLGWEIVVGRSAPSNPQEMSPTSKSAATKTEEAARDARYAFFRQVAEQNGARYVATGHTANDQAETILHRILRGTGVAGLAGIPRARPLIPAVTVIRPLLCFYRAELLDYLRACGQSYCRDATNDDPRYTRNRIRHQLLPQLASQYNPEIVEGLLRLGQTAADAQEVLDWQVDRWIDRFVMRGDSVSLELDTAAVVGLPRHLLRQLLIDAWRGQDWPLRDMGYEHWDALATMLLTEGVAARVFPGNVHVTRQGSRLCFQQR